MALSVDYQNIYLTRGDTADLLIPAYSDDEMTIPYEFQEGDKVFFHVALKPGQEVVISKECAILEDGLVNLYLEPEDTEELSFKVYRYEVELVTSGNEHFTFIADQPFEIGKEID